MRGKRVRIKRWVEPLSSLRQSARLRESTIDSLSKTLNLRCLVLRRGRP